MLVDSHCHLSFPELRDRVPQLLGQMREQGVERALCICTTIEEFRAVHQLALDHPELWCTVGVHPDSEGVHEPTVDELVGLASLPRVVAIGETGLDYFRLGDRTVADMAWQRDRLRTHVQAARRAGRPLVVHCRSAAEDTLAILREERAADAGGVFHCFTESADVARQALDLGFLISFSGILTFRNAEPLREVARLVPLDRCLVETDSPYLAPAPHRGRTNHPAWVVHVASALADLKGVTLQRLAEITTANFDRLFPLAREARSP